MEYFKWGFPVSVTLNKFGPAKCSKDYIHTRTPDLLTNLTNVKNYQNINKLRFLQLSGLFFSF
jgi:hypothetical protein